MSDAPVLVDVDQGVATVTLNRPEQMNALNAAMRSALLAALTRLDLDRDVRAIVLTGAGRGFCSGADRDEQGDIASLRARYSEASAGGTTDFPLKLSTPLIAAINGPVVGVGLSFALMADVRFASRSATWIPNFARLGLVAEHAIAWALPRLVGTGNALEMLLSGEPFTSEHAYRIGLVQRLTEPEDLLTSAAEFAATVAQNSPRSLAEILEQVRLYADLEWNDAVRDARDRVLASLDSSDFRAAITARAEKEEER